MVIVVVAEDSETVFELRGHIDEFSSVARYPQTTDKSDATERIQGQGQWKVICRILTGYELVINLSKLISRSSWNDPDHFIQRQSCLNTFAAVFG